MRTNPGDRDGGRGEGECNGGGAHTLEDVMGSWAHTQKRAMGRQSMAGCAHQRTWWRATHTPRGRCRTRLGAGSRGSPACTLSAPCEEDRGGLVRTQPGGCSDRRWREGQQQGKVSERKVWETRGPGKKGAVGSRARLGRGPGTRSRWGRRRVTLEVAGGPGDSGSRQKEPRRGGCGQGLPCPLPPSAPSPHTRAPPTAAS